MDQVKFKVILRYILLRKKNGIYAGFIRIRFVAVPLLIKMNSFAQLLASGEIFF